MPWVSGVSFFFLCLWFVLRACQTSIQNYHLTYIKLFNKSWHTKDAKQIIWINISVSSLSIVSINKWARLESPHRSCAHSYLQIPEQYQLSNPWTILTTMKQWQSDHSEKTMSGSSIRERILFDKRLNCTQKTKIQTRVCAFRSTIKLAFAIWMSTWYFTGAWWRRSIEPSTGGVNTPTQSEVLGTPVFSQATVIQSPDDKRSAGVAEMLTVPAQKRNNNYTHQH